MELSVISPEFENLVEPSTDPREMALGTQQPSAVTSSSEGWEAVRERYTLEISLLETFHRALVLHEEQAWEILTQRLSTTIRRWLRYHPNREEAYRLHNEEDYVALTMERLWMVTVRNPTLEFRSLPGALTFLRVSLNSVIIDSLRNQRNELSILEVGSLEPAAPVEEACDELWRSIKSLLPERREQRLAYLLFHCNLKPRQIVQFCPQEFCCVQEIFQMKRKILERLKRNKDRLRWLLGDLEVVGME